MNKQATISMHTGSADLKQKRKSLFFKEDKQNPNSQEQTDGKVDKRKSTDDINDSVALSQGAQGDQ